jgi:hypothetical protein
MAKSCSPEGNNPSSLGFTIVLAEVGYYAFVSILSLKLMTRRRELQERERTMGSLPTM